MSSPKHWSVEESQVGAPQLPTRPISRPLLDGLRQKKTVERLCAEQAHLRAENETLRTENQALCSENDAIREENGQIKCQFIEVVELLIKLQNEIDRLERENEELRQQLERRDELSRANSTNSSKPPSSDPPGVLKNRGKTKTGRKQGGQKGHPGRHRELVPEEEVDEFVDHHPEQCCHCGSSLGDEESKLEPVRHQVLEVEIKTRVTEHRLHRQGCLQCGKVTVADPPPGTPKGAFGPRLTAVVAMLAGRFRMSRRDITAFFQAFGISISLGSVKKLENIVSEALAGPTRQLAVAIQQASVVNMDETTWLQNNQPVVLWCLNTPEIALYRVTGRKSAELVQQLLGADFEGVVGSDRHSIYSSWLRHENWQVCLAHTDRHFQRFVDRGGVSEQIGREAQQQMDLLWKAWHEFNGQHHDRAKLQAANDPIKTSLQAVLERGTECCSSEDSPGVHGKTQRTCQNLLDVYPALWTFTRVKGVEPTNNSSEQGLRSGVRLRKNSFGSQSDGGSTFVERMLTASETCRRQGRDLFEFLVDCVVAKLRADPSPSLLPRPPTPPNPP